MRFKPRPSRKPLWIALGVIVLIFIVYVLVSNGRPRVASVFPDLETFPVPAPAPIQMTFDRPMNPEAVESAWVSTPAREGQFTWSDNVLSFSPEQPWPSGSVITVTLTTAARSASGLRLDEAFTWSFRTAPTLLAYLWPAGDPETTISDLYVLDPVEGEVSRLTETDFGVLDYSLNPNGLTMLLSVSNNLGGADIAELDLLSRSIETRLECGAALCSLPQYDPSGRLIAYENATSMEILLIDEDGTLLAVGSGRFPNWSPTGDLLGYDPGDEAYFIYNTETGEKQLFPNNIGEPARWAPAGGYFMAPVITALGGDSFASHLAMYPVSSNEGVDLTREPLADDYVPAISPNGLIVAFARRSLAPESWTPGRQLWIMAPDGSNAQALTAAGLYNHTALGWNPSSTEIVYVRSNQADLNEPPEIWVIPIDGGPAIRLVIGGFAPVWIP